MQTSLKGINNRAKVDANHRFGGLYRLLNEENLHWAYSQLNKRASSGVDGVTHSQYGQNLQQNLYELKERLKNKSYRTKLIRRTYIAKSATKMRPLGIPALEDKVVQYAAAKILESIYEADFIDDSYGYRPKLGAKDAVKKTGKLAVFGGFHIVVEADIKGFFDNIDHDWLLKMLSERIDDAAFIGLIRKWLKAGILEEDMVMHPESGTPQGGVISPVLANIYLHYILDSWFEKVVRKRCLGAAKIIRYADDFVCFFELQSDAEAYYNQLPQRLAKFGLEVAPEKTKLLSFSRLRHPKDNGSFVFLGFEFRWRFSRKGKPYVWKRTAPEKLRKGLQSFADWIRKSRSLKLPVIMKKVRQKLTGHYNYYALTGNSRALSSFYHHCKRKLFKWLNRRSQKRSYNWEGFTAMLKDFEILSPSLSKINSRAQAKPVLPEWGIVPLPMRK